MKNVIRGLFLLFMVLIGHAGFAQEQNAKDEAILKQYFAKNKIKATRTPDGLYYTISKKGSGENAKAGQKVNMLYYGKFLDGRKFDANMDENFKPSGRPFSFPLGRGAVIRGWDEGVQLLNPGTRATFYLPSSLAYGPQGNGPIPPNSVLAFDVELVSIDK